MVYMHKNIFLKERYQEHKHQDRSLPIEINMQSDHVPFIFRKVEQVRF